MKLRWLLVATHVVPAFLASALTGAASYWFSGLGMAAGLLISCVCACFAALWVGVWTRREFALLERAVETGDAECSRLTELGEFKQLAAKLIAYTEQWAKTLGHARQQTSEVATLLSQLNRRASRGPATPDQPAPASQLRQLLASLARTAEADLQQVVSCARDIERRTQQIGAGIDEQASAVNQTTTFVEQISANIDTVSQNADASHKAAVAARESAAAGLELVRELIRGMDRIRLHVAAGGKKLRTLGDRSNEIGSIVETIGSISARTDMLALNASIESVRAGEHGRGFAVVADEVRKLAEQTAQATREVTSLIESIQVESQESIAAIADEQDQVEAEVRRVNEAGTALERISQTSSDSAQRVGEISGATLAQLRVTQKVVSAMQRISEIARGIRQQTTGVCGTTHSLTDLANQLNNSLGPLRGCSAGPIVVPATRDDATRRPNDSLSDSDNVSPIEPFGSVESPGDFALVGAGTETEPA